MILQAKDTKIEKLGVAKYSAKIFSKIVREQDFILYDPFHKKQKFSSTNTEQPAFLTILLDWTNGEKKFILQLKDKVLAGINLLDKEKKFILNR